MKPGVIAGLTIISMILLFVPITLAQEGMWHSADEVGPGTFLPGLYKWDQDSQIDFSSDLDGDSFVMRFPASASTGLNIETNGKNTALLVTALGSNSRAAVFSGDVRVIGDLTTVDGDIISGGAIVAGGIVCDGSGNCLHSVGGGTGGGDSDWIMYEGNIYRDTGKVNIGIAYTDPSYWSPSQLNVMEDITAYGTVFASEFCVDVTGGGDYDCTTSWGTGGSGGITLADVENYDFVSLNAYEMFASRFISDNNNDYYLAPSSTSNLYGLDLVNDLTVSGDATFGAGKEVYMEGGGTVNDGLSVQTGGLQIHQDTSVSPSIYDLIVDEASGNVGIGTDASPSAALQIDENVDGDALNIRTLDNILSGHFSRLVVDKKGFVGIGTEDPKVGLQVGDGTPDNINYAEQSDWDRVVALASQRQNVYIKGSLEVDSFSYFGSKVHLEKGSTIDEGGLLIESGDLQVTGGNIEVSNEICMSGDCKSEWPWAPETIIVSGAEHDGDFGGYEEMNDWIQTHGYVGYHVCDGTEITRYLQNGGTISREHNSDSRVWYISGIYSMMDDDVDVIRDCRGWDSPYPEFGYTKADWGPVWRFDVSNDGRPGTALCENSYPVMCCK